MIYPSIAKAAGLDKRVDPLILVKNRKPLAENADDFIRFFTSDTQSCPENADDFIRFLTSDTQSCPDI